MTCFFVTTNLCAAGEKTRLTSEAGRSIADQIMQRPQGVEIASWEAFALAECSVPRIENFDRAQASPMITNSSSAIGSSPCLTGD
jgi:hypothetical protein